MKFLGRCGIVLLTALMLTAPAAYALASETTPAKGAQAKATSATETRKPADQWFAKGKDTPSMSAKAQKNDLRYIYLLNDNGFDYYMDSQNMHWINMPYTANERIVDVWVYLVSDGPQEAAQKDQKDAQGNYEYKSGSTYYLEHYYLRPKTRQIQFLSELEVTGRPDNAIKERPYSVQNWENLVPGSIEDDIFHQVMKKMPSQKNKIVNKIFGGKSVHDFVEDTLNIAL